MATKKRANTTATQRLKQDYMRIMKDPVPYITAVPLPSNILEWHYVVNGPENSNYEGGYYHGKLVFPSQYPFKPPSIYMITPNGRFKCNTRLCLSISDFHPDTWNPAWSVSTILTGLLSFMLETAPTLGSIESTPLAKKQLAVQSLEFNLKDRTFCELFPQIAQQIHSKIEELRKHQCNNSDSVLSTSPNNAPQDRTNIPELDNRGLFGHAVANICVVAGFAAFALMVKFVLQTISDE